MTPASEQSKSDGSEPRSQSNLTWVIPLAVIVVLIGLYFVWPPYQSFVDDAISIFTSGDRETARAWLETFGAWGYVVVLVLMVAQAVLAIVPSLLMMVVAVLAYGPVIGGALSWTGLLLAATVAYGIGRTLGPVTVDRIIGEKTERKISDLVERYGIWAVVASRISPAISTDVVSYVAGLLEMNYLRFIAATAAGTLPFTLAVAWLGQDIDRLKSGLVWVSVVGVAAFLGYVIYDRRRQRKAEVGHR